MNGVRLNMSSAIGMPMIVSWIAQATPIQTPDAHQPTSTNQMPQNRQCDLRAAGAR